MPFKARGSGSYASPCSRVLAYNYIQHNSVALHILIRKLLYGWVSPYQYCS